MLTNNNVTASLKLGSPAGDEKVHEKKVCKNVLFKSCFVAQIKAATPVLQKNNKLMFFDDSLCTFLSFLIFNTVQYFHLKVIIN